MNANDISIKYEKKMNHKNIENTCHIVGNMQFLEINNACSIAAQCTLKIWFSYWKGEFIHITILKLENI